MSLDTSLMKGLDDFSIPEAITDTKGADLSNVNNACAGLDQQAENIRSFAGSLEIQMGDMLNDWQGASADKFRESYPTFLDSFKKIAPCLESISQWAKDTSSNYSGADDEFTEALKKIYGGN